METVSFLSTVTFVLAVYLLYIWLMHSWIWLTFVFVDFSLNRVIERPVQAASELCKGLKVVMLSQPLSHPPHTSAMLSL